MASTVIFDDRDPAIFYTGGWGKAGVVEEFNSTDSYVRRSGATAKLTFSGTRVSVRGTLIAGVTVPRSSYSIDRGTATIFNTTMQQTVQYQHLLFESNELALASHNLVITTLSDDTYLLDYIEVTPLVTATPPVAAAKAGLPLGPIIGGSLGGLALLIFAFMLLRRRGNNRSHYGEPKNSSLWTSPNADLVPTHTALSGKRSLITLSTPSPNTSLVDAVHQGFHAHDASAPSPSNTATNSASTSDQVSGSIANLSPPPYQV